MKEIKLSGVDEKYYYDECGNGLPIYMWVNDKVSNYYATYNCKYGAVDTEFKLKDEKRYRKVPNGIAHFLEHVNFNLPNNEDATSKFNQLGATCNAFTTNEFTAYEVFGSSNFKEALEHLLDYVNTPYFTKKNVEKEKGIIIEEVKMGKNSPGHIFYYGANNGIFVKDKRKELITGEVEDVKNTTVEDLELVYNNFYHPKNMFVVVTGNFNPYEAAAIIKENQSKKEFPEYQNPIKRSEREPVMVNVPYKEEEANVELPKIKVTYKMDRNSFKNIEDLELRILLGMILRNNFGSTSLFKEELLENDLITGMGYEREVFNNVVIISIACETKYPTEMIDKIRKQIKNLNLTEEDLKRRKRCNIASLINEFDDIEYINSEIQDGIIIYGKVITNMFDYYENVKMETIKKIIKGINIDNESIFILKPSKKDKKNNS